MAKTIAELDGEMRELDVTYMEVCVLGPEHYRCGLKTGISDGWTVSANRVTVGLLDNPGGKSLAAAIEDALQDVRETRAEA